MGEIFRLFCTWYITWCGGCAFTCNICTAHFLIITFRKSNSKKRGCKKKQPLFCINICYIIYFIFSFTTLFSIPNLSSTCLTIRHISVATSALVIGVLGSKVVSEVPFISPARYICFTAS